MINAFRELFPKRASIIGMIHVWPGDPSTQVAEALSDLHILQGSVDGVIVENYGTR